MLFSFLLSFYEERKGGVNERKMHCVVVFANLSSLFFAIVAKGYKKKKREPDVVPSCSQCIISAQKTKMFLHCPLQQASSYSSIQLLVGLACQRDDDDLFSAQKWVQQTTDIRDANKKKGDRDNWQHSSRRERMHFSTRTCSKQNNFVSCLEELFSMPFIVRLWGTVVSLETT